MQTGIRRRPQRTGDVERARVLIRLHADEADQSQPAGVFDLTRDSVGPDAFVGFVDRENLDVDVVAERGGLHRVLRDSIEAGERVRRQRRPEPLDHITIIVVMRRLDEEQQKSASLRDFGHGSLFPRFHCPAAHAMSPSSVARALSAFAPLHNRPRKARLAPAAKRA